MLVVRNMWSPKLLEKKKQTFMSLQAEKHLVICKHISIFLLTRELPTWSRVLLEKILPILKYTVALVTGLSV